jgi:fatty acid desaturase/cytochrome b involved in lipid metabolism
MLVLFGNFYMKSYKSPPAMVPPPASPASPVDLKTMPQFDQATAAQRRITRPAEGTPPAAYYDSLAVHGAGDARVFTPTEVERHCLPTDGWLTCHGGVYDVTSFINKHPGGDIIALGLGRDCTILIESYHPAGRPDAVMEKYRIGTLQGHRTFYAWDQSPFYAELKRRVLARIKEAGRPRRGGLTAKAILVVTLFVGSFYMMVAHKSFLWAAAWGVAGSHIGLSIQHDGNHGSFSKRGWLNRLAGWGMDVIGASSAVWEFQHVIGHHQYTNLVSDPGNSLPENDPDIFSSYPLMRFHPDTAWKPHHQYQYLYAIPIFALMTVSKVLSSDFTVYFTNMKGAINCSSRFSTWQGQLLFWSAKILGFLFQIVLPCHLHGIPTGLGLFLTAHLVSGEYLAVCFIINHISESCDYLTSKAPIEAQRTAMLKAAEREMESKRQKPTPPANDWAATQVQCCVNWRSGGRVANHLSGGLNHQIEHHLFPSISHANYPTIAPVVREVCQEYGLPYRDYATFYAAVVGMLQHLRSMGVRPEDGGAAVKAPTDEVCPVLAAAAKAASSEGAVVPTQA